MGVSSGIRFDYDDYDPRRQTLAKNNIFLIKYKSRTADTFTNIGHFILSLGTITSLIVAPLISINYSNGNFNTKLYYSCALSGLAAATISIPMVVLSRAKNVKFCPRGYSKEEPWKFDKNNNWQSDYGW